MLHGSSHITKRNSNSSHRPGLLLLLLAGMALLFSPGCKTTTSSPSGGTIVTEQRGSGVGTFVPNATFVDNNGNMHRLSSLYSDATLLAFVPEACHDPSSSVDEGTGNLPLNVAVVEICNGDCESHAECLKVRGDRSRRLIVLCDTDDHLTHLFNIATTNAIFVLDRQGRIVAEGSLGDLPELRRTAESVAVKMQREREQLYGG